MASRLVSLAKGLFGFERRAVARRSGTERRVTVKVVKVELRKITRRVVADRRLTTVGSGLPTITATLVKPPKGQPTPPATPGADDLNPILVTRPDDRDAKTIAGGHFANWKAAANAPAMIDKNPLQDQVAAPGATVPIAPRVTVRDINGNPVNGVIVTFSVAQGGGAVAAVPAGGAAAKWVTVARVPTAGGDAALQGWRLGPKSKTVNVLVGTVNGMSVSFNATTT